LAESVLRFSEANPGIIVSDIVNQMSEGEDVPPVKVARSLSILSDRDEIKLSNPAPPRGVVSYLFSYYSIWYWMVVAGMLLTLVSIYVFPVWAPFSYIRMALGFISALYLPGAALIEALYPREEDFESLERFAVSVGVSIAVTPLVGFLLNYTPWGIRLNPIVISLTILTLILGLVGVYRKFTYFRLEVETISLGVRDARS
jgi:magnesium-transporting ATPase (P-type)